AVIDGFHEGPIDDWSPGVDGLVPGWFTFAATNRPETSLLAVVAWNVTDHGTSPWHLETAQE
ncbi:MAG: hypothetical protein R6U98_25145, partial [Pirellulaceae bacterium]